jgi:hypothetical protein
LAEAVPRPVLADRGRIRAAGHGNQDLLFPHSRTGTPAITLPDSRSPTLRGSTRSAAFCRPSQRRSASSSVSGTTGRLSACHP